MEFCRQFFNNFSSFFQKFLVLERFSVIVTHLLSFLTKTCTTYSFYTKTINNTNYSRSTEMHTFLEEKKWFFTHRKERKGIIHFWLHNDIADFESLFLELWTIRKIKKRCSKERHRGTYPNTKWHIRLDTSSVQILHQLYFDPFYNF